MYKLRYNNYSGYSIDKIVTIQNGKCFWQQESGYYQTLGSLKRWCAKNNISLNVDFDDIKKVIKIGKVEVKRTGLTLHVCCMPNEKAYLTDKQNGCTIVSIRKIIMNKNTPFEYSFVELF